MTEDVEVRTLEHGRGLFAKRAFRAGERVLWMDGVERGHPDRYSLQVGEHTHLVVPAGTDGAEIVQRYPWVFLNHACAPNTRVCGRELVALDDVPAGGELSFNYNSTEYDMADPFVCRCGRCGGRTVSGFRHLPMDERAKLRPILAAHLCAE